MVVALTPTEQARYDELRALLATLKKKQRSQEYNRTDAPEYERVCCAF